MSALLPFQLDPEHSSDFAYQINRPRKSERGLQCLKINRLSKWSVILLQGFQISVGQGVPKLLPVAVPQAACCLQLDINTDEDHQTEFPRENIVAIFEELVESAQEIATKGDIR